MAGEAAAIGATLGVARRAAGMRTVDDLVAQAMLHPRLAEALLQRATPRNAPMLVPRILASMRDVGAQAVARYGQQPAPPPPGQPQRHLSPMNAPRVSAFVPQVPTN